MLPTLQLVFLDRTEGPLDLRLLQLQVISKQQEKQLEEIAGKACNGETWRVNVQWLASVLRVIDMCSTCAEECDEFKSDVTHHRPCCLLVFASMPPSPAQSAFLVHAWHGALCPRHARFAAFDGGRYHR